MTYRGAFVLSSGKHHEIGLGIVVSIDRCTGFVDHGSVACSRKDRQRPTTARCCRSRRRHRRASPGRRCRNRSSRRVRAENRLPKDAPNILIVLLDDVGFGLPDTFGGEVHTPTLTRLANEGISYNAFHTTSICSPTRAALLTGRNHHRVGIGTIAERAVDWDGYTGVIPRTSATVAEGARQLRLQDRRLRQVAQHARDRRPPRWARSPAGRPAHRLRLFLRLPRRRDLAVGTAAVREPQSGRAAARREVSPDRGHGRQGDRLAAQASRPSRPTSRS